MELAQPGDAAGHFLFKEASGSSGQLLSHLVYAMRCQLGSIVSVRHGVAQDPG